LSQADRTLASPTNAANKLDLGRYRAALVNWREGDSAASAAATMAPPDDQRMQLLARVAHLRALEVTGLRATLAALDWLVTCHRITCCIAMRRLTAPIPAT
jgi:hypothetical protein